MSTSFMRSSDVDRKWILIDAEGMILGRMAVVIANILRGKNKPYFTPNADCGDNVIVINADKVALTGKKLNNKMFYWHTGYPGGIKSRSMKQLMEEPRSDRMVINAVKRMMSKGPLSRKILSKGLMFKITGTDAATIIPRTVIAINISAKVKPLDFFIIHTSQ